MDSLRRGKRYGRLLPVGGVTDGIASCSPAPLAALTNRTRKRPRIENGAPDAVMIQAAWVCWIDLLLLVNRQVGTEPTKVGKVLSDRVSNDKGAA